MVSESPDPAQHDDTGEEFQASPATSNAEDAPVGDDSEQNSPEQSPRDRGATEVHEGEGDAPSPAHSHSSSRRGSAASSRRNSFEAPAFDNIGAFTGIGATRVSTSSHRRGSLPGAPAAAPRPSSQSQRGTPPSQARGTVSTRRPSISANDRFSPPTTTPPKAKPTSVSTRRPSVSQSEVRRRPSISQSDQPPGSLPARRRPSISQSDQPPGSLPSGRVRSRRQSLASNEGSEKGSPSPGRSQEDSLRVGRQAGGAAGARGKQSPAPARGSKTDTKLPAVGKAGAQATKPASKPGSKAQSPIAGAASMKPDKSPAGSPAPVPVLPVIKKSPEELAAEAKQRVLERRAANEARFAERDEREKRTRRAQEEEHALVRDASLEHAQQVAWSYVFEIARDGEVDKLRALLGPARQRGSQRQIAAPASKKGRLPIEVDVNAVDWVKEELRGGARNARGQWFTDFVSVDMRGGRLRRTALHTACARGHLEVVRVLCEEFGADMDVVDDTGRTPVWEAAKHGHQEIVFFLVDAGAHADTADIEGNSATHMAVQGGYNEIVQVLVDAGADLLKANKKGVMAKDMYGKHVHLAAYLHGLGKVQAELMTPLDARTLHRDEAMPADRLHPDAGYRHRKGHVMYNKGFFLVCERHVETGECFISKSTDGFRTAERVAGPFPNVECFAVSKSGVAIAGLRDGRLLHSLDQFKSVAFVNPGRAHGNGTPLQSNEVAFASFGAAIRAIHVVDSSKSFAVGDAPPQSPEEVMRNKAWKLFAELDQDKSGAIDSKEFQKFVRALGYRLSATQTDAIMQMFDKNSDGHISFEEFFLWHRTKQRASSPAPLLIRSRNGGHSFERVEVPMEALETSAGKPLSLIDIAFGGEGNNIGVVLGRYQQYGVGKSLLLVTSDGGFTWNFIDPQEWFEAEKIRIDREKAEADRERARQLQEQLAEERRQQELEEARRRAAQLAAEEVHPETPPETQTDKPKTRESIFDRSSRRTSRRPSLAQSMSSSGSTPSSRGLSRSGSSRVSSSASGGSDSQQPSRVSSAASSKAPSPSSSRANSRPGSALKATASGASSGGQAAAKRQMSAGISRASSKEGGPSRTASRTAPASEPSSPTGDLAGSPPSDSLSFSAPLTAFGEASRRAKSPPGSKKAGAGKDGKKSKAGQPFMRADSLAQMGFGKGAKEEDGNEEHAAILAQKEAQLKELLAKKKGAQKEEVGDKGGAKEPDAGGDAGAREGGAGAGGAPPPLEKQATEGLLTAVAQKIGTLERMGSRLSLETKVDPGDFYDDGDDTSGAFDSVTSLSSPPPERSLSPVIAEYEHDYKAVMGELGKTAEDAEGVPDIQALAPLSEEDVTAHIEHLDSALQDVVRRFLPDLRVLLGHVNGDDHDEAKNPFAINPFPGSGAGGDWDAARTESTQSADVDFLRLKSAASDNVSSQGSPQSGGTASPQTDPASPLTDGTREESSSPERGELSPGTDRDVVSPTTERGNASAPPALISRGHRPESAAAPIAVPLGTEHEAGETEAGGEELEAFVRGAMSILETNQAGGVQTVRTTSNNSRPLKSVSTSPKTASPRSPPGSAPPGRDHRSSLSPEPSGRARASTSDAAGAQRRPSITNASSRAPSRSNSQRNLLSGSDSPSSSGSPRTSAPSSRQPSTSSLRSQSSTRNLNSGSARPARTDSSSSTSSSRSLSRPSSSTSPLQRQSSNRALSRGSSGRNLTREGSSTRLSSSGSADKKKLASKKDGKASAQKPKQALRQLREFTVERPLEDQQKKLGNELKEAEMRERALGVQLKQANFARAAEGHTGGPLSAKAINLQNQLHQARIEVQNVLLKIKTVLDESTKALNQVRDEQMQGVKSVAAREEQLKEEQKQTSKRGEEAKKKQKELQQQLEEAEHEKSYFKANVEHTEEAVEEELQVYHKLTAHRKTVDAWGSLGLEPRAGLVAGGLWLKRVGVTASGVLLLAGPGGVQRSTNKGHTWTRTLVMDAEKEATCLSVVGDVVYAVVDRSIHRSVDAGKNWKELGRCPPVDVAVSDMMQFCDADHGFVGNEQSNLFYTCDGGKTWEARMCTKKPFRFAPRLLAACGQVPP